MHWDTVYEALKELWERGPYSWEAIDLLNEEIQSAPTLRQNEKKRISAVLLDLPNVAPSQQERRLSIVEARFKRFPGYQFHVAQKVKERLLC